MKKIKNTVAVILAMALLVAASVGITVAYLTDRDSEENIFTLGNVDITLDEVFQQNSMLMPGEKIEKKPTIRNTGITDAWVWATVAIPAALDNVGDASKNVVHFNYTKESVAAGLWTWTGANGDWMVEKNVDINGTAYNVYTVLYQTPLKPGESTAHPVIHQVYMDDHVDVDGDGYLTWVENGAATRIDWNVTTQALPTIHVSAYAIQHDGFDNVWYAYAAYQAQWSNP